MILPRTDIDTIILREMESQPISGVAVGISAKGEAQHIGCHGFADLENGVPITEHTVFRIGSLTKQFTAVGILILIEEGLLHLDAEISALLPASFALPKGILLGHLLNHTSGLVNFTGLPEHKRIQRLDMTPAEVVALFAGKPLEFHPGWEYHYTNSGYYLLGMIIEAVTGKKYADFLRERVLAPAGLTVTDYLYNEPLVPNRCHGYRRDSKGFLNDEPLSMHIPFSAGALGSSVTDLLRWQEALHGGGLLPAKSYELMTTAPLLSNGRPSIYACGLKTTAYRGRRRIWHGGGIPGFSVCMSYYREPDLSIVVLCNTREAEADLIEELLARLVFSDETEPCG